MTGDLDYALPPAVRRIASAFRLIGWISFWTQVVLAIVSSLLLLFASGGLAASSNPGTGSGLILAVVGLLAVFLAAYWAFRYIRLSRQLKSSNPAARPKPKDALQNLRLGLIINLVGMLLTLLGSGALVGSLMLKSAKSLGAPILNSAQFVTPLDISIVQANTNTLLAHFVGLVATLWLFRVVNR